MGNTVICEKCGQSFGVGDWYQCPHGRYGQSVIGDEIPGGVTYENYGPKPVTFYSESARQRYMAEHGLTQLEKFCPTPGTDHDPAGVPNPKVLDAYTMESVRVLLTRVPERSPDYVDLNPAPIIQGQFVLVDGGKDAQALVDGDVKRTARVGRRIANAK